MKFELILISILCLGENIMLETDIKKMREQLFFKLSNAEDLELQWEAKAYKDCMDMVDAILKANGVPD
jgi:hypothetical protein